MRNKFVDTTIFDDTTVRRFLRGIGGNFVGILTFSMDSRDSCRSSRDHARKIGYGTFDEVEIETEFEFSLKNHSSRKTGAILFEIRPVLVATDRYL